MTASKDPRGCYQTKNASETVAERVRSLVAAADDGALEAEALEAPVERAAADAEQPRRDLLVAARVLQRAQDVVALDGGEQRRLAVGERRCGERPRRGRV